MNQATFFFSSLNTKTVLQLELVEQSTEGRGDAYVGGIFKEKSEYTYVVLKREKRFFCFGLKLKKKKFLRTGLVYVNCRTRAILVRKAA